MQPELLAIPGLELRWGLRLDDDASDADDSFHGALEPLRHRTFCEQLDHGTDD
jgi:hypothetical protein